MGEWSIQTKSRDETIGLAKHFSSQLKAGDVLALEGDLGSGKTTFMKGLALGLGLQSEDEVTSPTFVLMHVYETKPPVYHFDLYRLENDRDFSSVGLEEHLLDSKAIKCIEWADRASHYLPQETHWIRFKSCDPETREITVQSETLRRD